jgi:cell wall-associated NlpC family hydrolase
LCRMRYRFRDSIATSVPEEKAMMTSKASNASNSVVDGAVSKAAVLDRGGPQVAGGSGDPRAFGCPVFFQRLA